MGSFGSLSSWAKVIPGFEFGLVLWARGSLTSEGKDCWLSLADASDRVAPLTSLPVILTEAVAKDSFREPG